MQNVVQQTINPINCNYMAYGQLPIPIPPNMSYNPYFNQPSPNFHQYTQPSLNLNDYNNNNYNHNPSAIKLLHQIPNYLHKRNYTLMKITTRYQYHHQYLIVVTMFYQISLLGVI